jgi:hypothetical protein
LWIRPPGGESVPRLAVVGRQRPWGSPIVHPGRSGLAFNAFSRLCSGRLVRHDYGLYTKRPELRQSSLAYLVRKARGLAQRQKEVVANFGGRWRLSSRAFARWPGDLPLWIAPPRGMQSWSPLTTGRKGLFALGCCGANEAKAPTVRKGTAGWKGCFLSGKPAKFMAAPPTPSWWMP